MSCCWLASDMGHGSKERDASVHSPKRRNWNHSWALPALLEQFLLSVFCFQLVAGPWEVLCSEEPLLWCALVVPGGVKTWLCCPPEPVGFLFCRSEILAYAKLPRESCWKAPSCPAAHLFLLGMCLGLRQLKPWTLQNELPPFLALTTAFSPRRRDLSEKITRQNVFNKTTHCAHWRELSCISVAQQLNVSYPLVISLCPAQIHPSYENRCWCRGGCAKLGLIWEQGAMISSVISPNKMLFGVFFPKVVGIGVSVWGFGFH